MPAAQPKMGRPSTFSEELATEICTRIAEGEGLRGICRDEHMPAPSTVFLWLTKNIHADFSEQYARARELQAEHLVDEILEISDDGTNDWMDRQNADGTTGERVLDHEHVQRSRLRVDSRKWFASKVAPKKYGDKVIQEHTGADGTPFPVQDNLALARVVAFLLRKGEQEAQAVKPLVIEGITNGRQNG